jgi:hypothetical protein
MTAEAAASPPTESTWADTYIDVYIIIDEAGCPHVYRRAYALMCTGGPMPS